MTSGGTVILNPGDFGLVGGSPENDQSVTMTVDDSGDAPVGTGELQQGAFTLPIFSDAAFTPHTVSNARPPSACSTARPILGWATSPPTCSTSAVT